MAEELRRTSTARVQFKLFGPDKEREIRRWATRIRRVAGRPVSVHVRNRTRELVRFDVWVR